MPYKLVNRSPAALRSVSLKVYINPYTKWSSLWKVRRNQSTLTIRLSYTIQKNCLVVYSLFPREQCSDILAMDALTGCDTTSYPFGKGKLSALTVLGNANLQPFGNKESTREEVVEDGRRFFAFIYGSKCDAAMRELRCKIFCSRPDAPKIKALPPTNGALYQHILRAWKCAEDKTPP